ncbi:MAG: hypothetical protein MI975_14965 [Cytophagales bacterium]|nr:hypothetical protein [Cytophagales bacterium]
MKKYSFALPLLFILGLAYWRYTYILNPNFSGEPFLFEIRKFGNTFPPHSAINIKSIIIYWILFFLGNIGLFVTLFASFEKVKATGFFYLLLSAGSVLFFGLDHLFTSASFFGLASILKNFLLSPMFTAIAYIVIEYFHWFGKSA